MNQIPSFCVIERRVMDTQKFFHGVFKDSGNNAPQNKAAETQGFNLCTPRCSYLSIEIIFQSAIVPVSDEKTAPILYSCRLSEPYSTA